MALNLLIHFQPGARGDFLANVLLGKFNSRKNIAMAQPKYVKVHHVGFHLEFKSIPINGIFENYDVIKNFNGIKIRIDPGFNPVNLMTIEANHLIKNKDIEEFNLDDYDTMYRAASFFLNNEYDSLQKNKKYYNYWIDFDNLSNIEFLKNLYLEINGYEMQEDLLSKYKENISLQKNYLLDNKFRNLIKVLDFEIKNSCLNKIKYYNLLDNLNNIEPFLNLDHYEKN